MKQSWLKRNFGWIRDDFRHMLVELRKPETWVVIGMVIAFGLIAFLVVRMALRSDTLLRASHPGAAVCRELGEKLIAFLFFSGLLFVLCALASLGEFFNFIDCKRQQLEYGAKQALKGAAGWGVAAVSIGLSSLFLLDVYCT
ncbi:MAG: hypothetical protein H6R18_1897 [Proteobacteria bacterium]|nr:hypothetical protein [Pseudomonadota bacterium]